MEFSLKQIKQMHTATTTTKSYPAKFARLHGLGPVMHSRLTLAGLKTKMYTK